MGSERLASHPLEPPGSGSPVLGLFLERFGVKGGVPSPRLLHRVASAFSRIPYENLTKIIKRAREPSAERARRWPLEVISEHLSLGAGGTCFSLTAALLHIVRALGWRAEPVLADRSYGPNTHCALLVWIDGVAHLVDPGFLILRPVALGKSGEVRIATAFNEVVLKPQANGEKVDLHTIQEGRRSLRLTIKSSPADAGEFLKAWDDSFEWEMMRYPLLTRVRGNSQVYLHERRLQVRNQEECTRMEVPLAELPLRIAREFALDPAIAFQALDILRRRGELHGRARAR